MVESEEQLLQRAIAGDADSFCTLLKRNGPMIRRIVSGRIPSGLRSVLSEDDVVQETYAAAFLSISEFEPNGSGAFARWLGQIARHTLLDAIRDLTALKRGGRPRQQRRSADDGMRHLAESLLADGTTPSEGARRRELSGHLQRAMEQLPDTYRDVVGLYDLEMLSAEEAAKRLGCSPGAMFMRRRRAHRTLSTILARFSDYL